MRIGGASVGLYRKHISKDYNAVRGNQCAYHTSCSAYAQESIQLSGVRGLDDTVARLRKCTAATRDHRQSELWRYTANCPESRLEEFFHFSDPQVREQFLSFRSELLASAGLIAQGQHNQGAEASLQATKTFLSKVHFAVDDKPGDKDAPRHFHLSPRRTPTATVMADRGRIGNGLRSGAGTAVAATGALIGGITGALFGAALGAYEGALSGLGLGEVLEHRAQEKHGIGALGGTKPLRDLGSKIYDGLQSKIGLEPLSGLIGGPLGLMAGFVGGLLGGGATLAQTGWDMGKILGRNASDERLAGRFASKGEMVVAPAKVRPESAKQVKDFATREVADEVWGILTNTPQEFLPDQARPEGAPSWQFAVFSDATAHNIESQEIRRVLEFERELPEGTTARIHMRRGGLIPRRFRKLLTTAKLAASVVGLAMLGGSAGLPLLAIASKTSAVASGVSAVKEMVRDSHTDGESDWTGRRTYALTSALETEADQIQSRPLDSHSAVGPVSATKLASDLKASFSGEGPRVALFAGHANSYNSVAGYAPEVLGEAFSTVASETGQKTDLVVVDACKAATLEALSPLAEGARYALVSQLPVGKMGMPWHSILKNIDALGQSPEQLGANIVRQFGGSKILPSLSLVDLEALPNLNTRLAELSTHIPEDVLGAGDLSQVREEGFAKRLARKLNSWKPGSQSVDLKAVLKELDSRLTDEKARQALADTREALNSCVVVSKGLGLGGLSVEGTSPFFHQESYQEDTQMSRWGDMLADEQPKLFKPLAELNHNGRALAKTVTTAKNNLVFGKPE